ncbi:MAG: hypothetical protein DBY32_02070 [Phascolarctobacterium sp.]|nr:MAG: hypothetical protein DBY32_02070 [Phascolarctobacterium sp.]
MKIFNYINNIKNISEIMARKVGKFHENAKIAKRKSLYIDLTKDQKRSIDEFFYKNFGEKINYNWHRLYTSYTGNFDVKYFPEYLYIPLLERIWNPPKYKYALADKNLLPLLVNGIENLITPETLVTCTNGIIRDKNFKIININDARKILNKESAVFIKPSIESSSGRGCKIISTEELNIEDCIKWGG